ncbi:hypothetical protein [Govanella unica]|uniref:Glycosyltransferase RgtA/B/C/D-like domain-containing protein n=1 Tax=Govanella unica TaxID=2975056 RepID=A0A9X3TUL4_9PROT|nr:hypothetical protein [Govania unica]MDA5192501.1 hypothetical protein [Govania unica]
MTAVLCGLLIVLWIGRNNPPLQLLLLCAFILRAGAGLAHIYLFPLPDTELDATTFEKNGWQWALQGWSYAAHNFTLGAFFYSWIVSIVYLITDRSPLLIQVINNLLAVGIVLNVFKLSRYLYSEHVARKVTWIAVLMPSMILYGTTTHREAFFTFFFTLGCYHLVKWYNERSLIYFVSGSVFVIFSAIFHYAAIFCLGAFYAGIYFTYNYRIIKRGMNFLSFVSITLNSLVFFALFFAIYNFEIGAYSISFILGGDSDAIKSIVQESLSHAEGRLAYLQDFEVNGLGDLLILTPLRIVYFFFSPFIWNLQAVSDILISGEGIVYFIIIILIFRSLIFNCSKKSSFPLLVMLAAAIFIFSFGSSNSGTAFRHKAKIAPLMICLIAYPLRSNHKAKNHPARPFTARRLK